MIFILPNLISSIINDNSLHRENDLNIPKGNPSLQTIYEYQCNSTMHISLYNFASIKCQDYFDLVLDYDQFIFYIFTIINSQINIQLFDIKNKSIDYCLSKILASLTLRENVILIFTDFITEPINSKYAELYPNLFLMLNFTWEKYIENTSYCSWDHAVYYNKYSYLQDYFDYLDYKTQWRKFCFNNIGYFYHQDKVSNQIVTIASTSSWILICSLIIIVISIIMSLYLIGYYRYI